MRLYFGHPINTYGTELERELLAKIAERFPGTCIVNPAEPEHQEGVKRWQEKQGWSMGYFLKELVPTCDLGVFLRFRDGKIGAGVYGEVTSLEARTCSVYCFVEEAGNWRIIPWSPNHRDALTVEETRVRIRDADGNTIPY